MNDPVSSPAKGPMTDPAGGGDGDSVVRVAMIGCGTVGAALVTLLAQRASVIQARTGLMIELVAVAVRDTARDRGVDLDGVRVTNDVAALVRDPQIDVVVELMGGIEPARSLVLAALESGKSVVTANKALIAAHGPELFAAADAAGVDMLFEAAVAGGVPFVRPLRESLQAEPIDRVLGIVNGTTNFMLSRMTASGVDYDEVLAEAQVLGYAEADPSADVDGHDAAAKIAIVASIAFGAVVTAEDVACEGIRSISAADIAFARRHGHVIKLLAAAERFDGPDGVELSARVHPCLVPDSHPLASVDDSFNAVFVEGRAVGELMFYGRGAGGTPTASAVLGDLVDASINRRRGCHGSVGSFQSVPLRPAESLLSEYYVRVEVADRSGVLAAIATAFGKHDVSIASMEQTATSTGRARLDFITHRARDADLRRTVAALRELESVDEVGSIIRVLGHDGSEY